MYYGSNKHFTLLGTTAFAHTKPENHQWAGTQNMYLIMSQDLYQDKQYIQLQDCKISVSFLEVFRTPDACGEQIILQ